MDLPKLIEDGFVRICLFGFNQFIKNRIDLDWSLLKEGDLISLLLNKDNNPYTSTFLISTYTNINQKTKYGVHRVGLHKNQDFGVVLSKERVFSFDSFGALRDHTILFVLLLNGKIIGIKEEDSFFGIEVKKV